MFQQTLRLVYLLQLLGTVSTWLSFRDTLPRNQQLTVSYCLRTNSWSSDPRQCWQPLMCLTVCVLFQICNEVYNPTYNIGLQIILCKLILFVGFRCLICVLFYIIWVPFNKHINSSQISRSCLMLLLQQNENFQIETVTSFLDAFSKTLYQRSSFFVLTKNGVLKLQFLIAITEISYILWQTLLHNIKGFWNCKG